MMYGIDVSEHNGCLDWKLIKSAGMQFAIIRCSYGLHEDSKFMENIYNATNAGLKCGVYHYSYALSQMESLTESNFVRDLINDSGCLLELPIFLDMEDSDYYKANRIDITRELITDISEAFIDNLKQYYDTGIYANLNWLENLIDWEKLNCAVWSAQWSNVDDFKGYMWQFTDKLNILGNYYDGDILYI
jgi:lysozyme